MVATSKRRPVVDDWGPPELWTVPVPDLVLAEQGNLRYQAMVSNGFVDPSHLGVDLFYRRSSIGDQPRYVPGSHDGDERWFNPPTTPIVAARDGVVWSAGLSKRGYSVVIDHGGPFATFYQHLSLLDVPEREAGSSLSPYPVKAGDQIGMMGYDPTDPGGLRHLHFAVWYKGAGDDASVDPQVAMSSWRRTSWLLA
jgi:murein DD-endopeptidase MepM/ murein hydrolase activator NlpD